MLETDPSLPVRLLTGFLGAGKTTLLNAIFPITAGPRVAVIVNEFGEVDHDLIAAVDEVIVLMQSGCPCCSINGDLSRTLQDLISRRQEGIVTFDHVVIETTCLADPAPILKTLLVDPYIAQTFRTNGVATMTDAAPAPDTLDSQFEAVSQIAMSDLIVLTKSDLVTEDAATAFVTRLRSLSPTSQVMRANHDAVPNAVLWDLSVMHNTKSREKAVAWVTPATPADTSENMSGFAPTVAIQQAAKTHDTLIMLRGPIILRVKGIVHLEGIETPLVFRGVQQLFDPPVPLYGWPSDDRKSRIVVIARDMAQPELLSSLDILRIHHPPISEAA
ncbi:CobW family GTP-binding protein [Celeribacter marinus]|uniref:CobW family GTP-binding protein n=1 Tax=Celeribacter marinus TaxID=1397108 RepID=UPI003F6A8AE2